MLLDFRFLDLNQTLCGHFCKRLRPVGNESVPCIVEDHQAQCFFYLFIFWIHRREYTDSAKALFSSCYFLTCDVTLTAVHMALYISRRHLILVGGGKTVSDNDTMSRHGLLATKCIFIFTCHEETSSDNNARHIQSGKTQEANTLTVKSFCIVTYLMTFTVFCHWEKLLKCLYLHFKLFQCPYSSVKHLKITDCCMWCCCRAVL